MKNKKTDLEQVKSIAKTFLYLDIQTTKFSPIVTSHPFFDSAIVGIKDEGRYRVGNIIESDADLELARKIKVQMIDEAESVLQISLHITKPYKLVFLKYAKKYLSAADIGAYLSSNWSLIENISGDLNVSKKEIVGLFKSAGHKTLLSDEEQKALDEMESVIEIYRGIRKDSKAPIKGLSWTLSIKTARYFANRFHRGGYVYRAYINKENVLAYFTGRLEEEIVADYKNLQDITLIEEIKPSGEIVVAE